MRHHLLRLGGRGLSAALGVVLVLSACGGDADAEGREAAEAKEADGGGTTVEIVNFVFEPQEVQVSPGAKVIWVNKDSALHNVQDLSDLNIPVSMDLAQGYKFSIRYEKAGTYPYVCGLHPYMAGTVKVG